MIAKNATLKVTKADYHRNGISGNGFHVCLFTWAGEGYARNMMAVLFEEKGSCAVFDTDLVTKGIIGMHEGPGNAWRGDHFEAELRSQVKSLMDQKYNQLFPNHPKKETK